jgi:hypothetical protein
MDQPGKKNEGEDKHDNRYHPGKNDPLGQIPAYAKQDSSPEEEIENHISDNNDPINNQKQNDIRGQGIVLKENGNHTEKKQKKDHADDGDYPQTYCEKERRGASSPNTRIWKRISSCRKDQEQKRSKKQKSEDAAKKSPDGQTLTTGFARNGTTHRLAYHPQNHRYDQRQDKYDGTDPGEIAGEYAASKVARSTRRKEQRNKENQNEEHHIGHQKNR